MHFQRILSVLGLVEAISAQSYGHRTVYELKEKVERLNNILAAGDRVARAAATMGEKREIDTLAEEDEEDEDQATSGAQSSVQSPAPREVLGTVS